MKNRYFAGLLLTFVGLSITLALFIFPKKSTIYPHWIPVKFEWLKAKRTLSNQSRILILAGSNGQFGIDSNELSILTGKKILNLSSHAGLDLGFYRSILKKYLVKDDFVVMPLEFNHYYRQKLTSVHTESMSNWGMAFLDTSAKIDLAKAINFKELFTGRLQYWVKNGVSLEEVRNKIANNNFSPGLGYNWQALTSNGEFIHDLKTKGKALSDSFYGPRGNRMPLSQRFIEQMYLIQNYVEEIGAQLILTYPTTMRNPKFDLQKKEDQNRINDFSKLLSSNGFSLHCDPALFHFNREFFFNTVYHLNKQGVIMRTTNLSKCIKNVIDGKSDKIKISETYARVSEQQRKLNESRDVSSTDIYVEKKTYIE